MKKSHSAFKLSSYFSRLILLALTMTVSLMSLPVDTLAFDGTDSGSIPIEDNLGDITDVEFDGTVINLNDPDGGEIATEAGIAGVNPDETMPDIGTTELNLAENLEIPEGLQYTVLTHGNVTVSGIMPFGAHLNVSEVPAEAAQTYAGIGKAILFAYDIKLMTIYGEEYQPGAINPLTVSIVYCPDAACLDDMPEILHVSTDNTGTTAGEAVQNISGNNGVVEFVAESFSLFIGTTPSVMEQDESATKNGDGSITFDLAKGNVTFGATFSGYDSNGLPITGTHNNTNQYFITQSTNTATSNRIIFLGASPAPTYDVTIRDINCSGGTNCGDQNDNYNPIHSGICAQCSLDKDIKLILRLSGTNHVGRLHYSTNGATGGSDLTSECQSSLTITSADGDNANTGTLYAESKVNWSAAIGGTDSPENTKNIIIKGGTIYANSLDTAAIGGGGNGVAVIEIKGGVITANNNGTGATIGGGGGANLIGAEAKVTITGGIIHATNKGIGTAIGAGSSPSQAGGYGEINISDGTITASSGSGTTIGGGNSLNGNGGNGRVSISSGTVTSGNIGGGNTIGGLGGTANVNISGGVVSLTNNSGIFGGNSSESGGGTATVNISGGTIVTPRISGGYSGLSIYEDAQVIISGGSVNIADRSNIRAMVNPSHAELYLNLLNLPGKVNEPVTSIALTNGTYNVTDMYTDAGGDIYLWLPRDVSVTAINGQSTHSVVPTATITHSNNSVGTTLTAMLSNGTAKVYSWLRSSNANDGWEPIPGATAVSYITTSADNGKYIKVLITDESGDDYYSGALSIVSPTYVVIIPDEVITSTANGLFSVKGTRSYLQDGSEIDIKLSTDDGNFVLNGHNQNLQYNLYTDSLRTSTVSSGQTIASFRGNGTTTIPVYFTIADTPRYAGTYTDTLTFTVTFNSGA